MEDFKVFTEEQIEEYTSNIIKNIRSVDKCINKINKKKKNLKIICNNFQNNKSMFNIDNLKQIKFQYSLLDNDKNYIENVKQLFIEHINTEFFELYNNIVILLSSIANIRINETDNLSIIKKIKKVNFDKTNDKIDNFNIIIDAIKYNLNLITNILNEFTIYIDATVKKIKFETIHCNNIYTSLTHKRQKIDIEYKKYSTLFNTLLSYYFNFSKYINKQSNNMNVLEFCTNNSISLL
jgi:hypothetical protein